MSLYKYKEIKNIFKEEIVFKHKINFERCNKIPNFNYKNKTTWVYYAKNKLENMIDIKHKKYNSKFKSNISIRDTKLIKPPINVIYLDLETCEDKIIEIAAIRADNSSIFNELVNPQMKIPENITKFTNINDEMVKDKDSISDVLKRFNKFLLDDDIIIGHNIDAFDSKFLIKE